MKTPKVGIVSATILMIVAVIGFGIAQAGDPRTNGEFMEWQSSQAAISPAEDMQLTSAGQEFVPEDNWSGTDWQTRGPVETGAIPGAVFEDSSMKDYGND
jgi:hypothetical protein